MSLFSIRLTLTLKLYSPLARFILFCFFSLRTGEIASKVKSSTRSFQQLSFGALESAPHNKNSTKVIYTTYFINVGI